MKSRSSGSFSKRWTSASWCISAETLKNEKRREKISTASNWISKVHEHNVILEVMACRDKKKMTKLRRLRETRVVLLFHVRPKTAAYLKPRSHSFLGTFVWRWRDRRRKASLRSISKYQNYSRVMQKCNNQCRSYYLKQLVVMFNHILHHINNFLPFIRTSLIFY